MISYPYTWTTADGKIATAKKESPDYIILSVEGDSRKLQFRISELEHVTTVALGPWIQQAYSEWAQASGEAGR